MKHNDDKACNEQTKLKLATPKKISVVKFVF